VFSKEDMAWRASPSGSFSIMIVQASRGARSYPSDIMLRHMVDALTEIHPQTPLCVHLDHGNEPAACLTAIQAGFTSVMMDGSLKADAGGLGLQRRGHQGRDGHGASGRYLGRGRARSAGVVGNR
jgi:rhodanese-related sulfurtransferase